MRSLATVLVFAWLWPQIALAQERGFRLAAPVALAETGFLKHILPRFSLKTGIRITLVDEDDAADARFASGSGGVPIFSGPEHEWSLEAASGGKSEFIDRFAAWLGSDIGRRTITSFEIGGTSLYSPGRKKRTAAAALVLAGDAAEGERLSLLHCGRCHVVSDKNRMGAIGSTPSFALLRSFGDWQARFQSFYVLNPHPAFTQVAEVTEPFSDQLPPPIVPLEVTLDDIGDIINFVSTIAPAELGAPLEHQ